MTKTNFFKIMREYCVTAGASVKQMPALNGVVTVFIHQPSAPNAFVARHKVGTGAFELAKLNYTKWLADWFLNLPALVEADHGEALRMDALMFPVETVHAETRIIDAELDLVAGTVLPANRTKYLHSVWAAASTGARAAWLEEAHTEALRMDDVTDLEQMVALMNHEEAHTEALGINAQFDIARVNAARVQSQFYGAYDYARRRNIVDEAHDEAIKRNAILSRFPQDWVEYPTVKQWCMSGENGTLAELLSVYEVTDAVRTLSHFHGANAAIERNACIEPRRIARERAVFYTLTCPADRQALIERLHEVALEIDYQAFR